MNNAVSQTLGLTLALGLVAGANAQELMPDHDASRRERLDYTGGRLRTADGFQVESAATPGLFGSVVNMTFDAAGRPLLALEGDGLAVLEDGDGNGVYDRRIDFAPQVETAHGLYVMGPGDLLVHANGDGRLAEAAGVEGEVRSSGAVEDTGLYRLRDTDGDDRVDKIERIARATGRIQEHGPHTIARGPDGALYLLYGNYSGPDVAFGGVVGAARTPGGPAPCRASSIRGATPTACARRAARSTGSTWRRTPGNGCPAGCATRSIWRSGRPARCSPTRPTWSGTAACPGSARPASFT